MKNLKKLLASALLVCMLVSLLPVNALAEDEVCAHSETYVETVSPGCTTAGSNTTKCSACGTPLSSETISATGHTPGEAYVTAAASCTTEGSTAVSCTVCGVVLSTGVIQALGHSYSEAVTKAATCTEAGVKTFTCSGCDDSYTETIAVLGHSFSDATCTAPKTCGVCGAIDGEPLGHDYADATCTVPKTCKVCTATEGEPLGHTAGETVTEPATCTVDGSITVKCTVCGEAASTETIPATGHTAGEETVITKATCIAEGSKSVNCTVCDETYTVVIPATGHTAGEETVITKATCIAEGSKSVKCTVCGETYTAIIPATGAHIEGAHTVTKEATCDEAGEETISCATEGCEYSETMEIPALGHKYNEQHECSVCGKKEPLMKNAPSSNTFKITGDKIVHVDEKITLSAVDGDNNLVSVTWSSGNTDVATVDGGVVTGIKGGNVTITATDGNNNEANHSIHVHEYAWDTTVSAQGIHQKKCSAEGCPAPIIENAAHSFKYDNTKGYFCETCTYVLGKPQITRTDGTSPVAVGGYFELGYSNIPHVANVTWEYNADELSAEPSGFSTRFTAKEAGDLTISLKADGETVASYTQNVLANGVPATAVAISPESKTAYVGEMITFGTTLTPDNSTDKITWSTSDPTVVEPLNPNGQFVAVATGNATITAKANDNATATATITVVEKTIQITGGNTKLAKDATLTLTATVTPDDESNPTPIEWTSSHPDIATVGKDTGVVTGKAKGTATITATANDNSGASASVKVYVYEDNTGYIAVEKDLIDVGESIEVRLVHPNVGDTDSVTWSVSPAGAATITGTNCGAIVTGQFAGIGNYFTVSAKFSTGEATNSNIRVKIPTIDVTGADSVLVGKTAQFAATVSPKYKEGITVSWTSSDTKIATVDKNGVVTGVANGTVRITATASDDDRITASKEITVKAPDLTVSGPNSVVTGKTITLKADITPADAPVKTVTWTSSDTSIATVDKNTGVVTGVKADPKPVTIKAIADADNSVYAEHLVKVISPVYLYYGNGSHFNGIHAMPFVSSDLWAGGAGVNVIINGVPLVPGRDFSCYSSPHGMIGVTVNPGLLRLLPQNAWHSIEIVSANGVAAGSFSTGYFGYYNIYGVKTGDDSTPLLWAALCLLGISGAGIILAKSRKRKA